jgi:TonB family protein
VAGIPVPEVAAPGSRPNIPKGSVAIRVEDNETGRVVEAVMVPQQDGYPAFAEAALEMARDWQSEAPPAGTPRTTRMLKFRQSAGR